MKVTYNWLKDFVDIKVPAKTLAERLTMAGLEVTRSEDKNGDVVFELEITSNRPDLLSVIGIAREVAAITGKILKLNTRYSILDTDKNKPASSIKHPASKLEIKVEDKKDCPLYTARIIKGIKVMPSPDWLKKRLELIGLRSVNNIVDVTNYVLMQTGQPLHAFDLNRIQGDTIYVRRAKDSEEIILIDGQKRNLTREILIIVDKQKPIAVAGIMGGGGSEVTQGTCDILLEAAVFDPITIRRASRTLGVSSESSYRFERGIDAQAVESASLLAAKLILELAGGKLILSKSAFRPKTKKKTITLKHKQVNRILGRDYAAGAIKKALASLCFSVGKQSGGDFKIRVPSFRIDVSQAVDLVEEVARISGYENIPSRLPRIIPQDARMSSDWRKRRQVKNILISQGINEVVTYSLISKSMSGKCGYSVSGLTTIANPLTNQQEVLRPGLLPGLIACISYNLNQKQRDIRIFEIGDIFRNNQEQSSLGLAYYGRQFNLLHIKGLLELLLQRLEIMDFEFIKLCSEHSLFQKEKSLSLILNKRILANLGMIKPGILERLDIEDYVFAAELDLEMLFAETGRTQKRYIPIPLYPEVMRDISIIVKKDIPLGDIIRRIMKDPATAEKGAGEIPYLVELSSKAEPYLGKQIPAGHKGLTLSCIYRASERTLTTQEVDASHQKVLHILRTDFSAQQR